VSQLRRYETEFARLDVRVKLVTFDANFLAQAYVRQTQLRWPLLVDQSREIYEAYGMLRASPWQLYNPLSILKYLGLVIRGVLPGRPGEDFHQLGGDVLIDPGGIVRVHFRSASPHDRPPVKKILQIVRSSRV
jgi:alkyl hydroperoxide reductase subunit AhpC